MCLYVLAFSTHIKHRGQEYQIDLVDTAGQVSIHSEFFNTFFKSCGQRIIPITILLLALIITCLVW